MRSRPPFELPLCIAWIVLLVTIATRPVYASGATDYFRAGRQAWLEKDWDAAIRQFSLALADSLPASRRADALFYRADALIHAHECAKAAEDVSALRATGSLDASRSARLERALTACEDDRPTPTGRTSPLYVRVSGSTHRYSRTTPWLRTFGAELALASGSLQGLVRGGSIGSNDYGGELGLRWLAPSTHGLRPWIEGTAGLQRLRSGSGFFITTTIVEWDSFTTTLGSPPGPSFHGTSLGLGVGLDVPLRSFLGVGLACRWRDVHWKSDMPAALPGDDREIAAYLFSH